MEHLPASWAALCAVVFLAGMRHGFDADHLATIDGLSRYNAHTDPRLSRLAGAWFSLGHGAVVVAIAAAASALSSARRPPDWLEASGTGISIAFLLALAAVNLYAVFAAPAGSVVAPRGIRSRFLGRFVTARSASGVAAVGALFAVSFDTVSLAVLFALAASRMGGMAGSLFVALLFAIGMLAVDGMNGFFISHLIRRADRTAAIASRTLALAIAAVSLLVASLALSRLGFKPLDAWMGGRGSWVSAGVVALVVMAFSGGLLMARRRVGRRSPA